MSAAQSLPYRHLTTLSLDVDYGGITRIGQTPLGRRGIAPVRGGRFEGERLSGSVAPGHDWFVTRADGTLVIDVRLTLTTGDEATVYLAYRGRMTASDDAMARFGKGETLAVGEYALTIIATFECGDPRYQWLNDAIVVGTGMQQPGGPLYTLFEINP